MRIELTRRHNDYQYEVRAFVEEMIAPQADRWDKEERLPLDLINALAQKGYLGAMITRDLGGKGIDPISYGLLNEEIGRGCSAVRSLLTVHDMVSQAVIKWGSKDQKARWAPRLTSGQSIAAFGLTEPKVGSDAKNVETTATCVGDSYLLDGCKKWVTAGQIADLFLILARCEGQPTAFLVERGSPSLEIKPISGMLGVRASMLADLHFERCRIPIHNLLGRVGSGFSHVAALALDLGRYSVAWGCVGVTRACLEACISYTSERMQFALPLKDHQLIRRMITQMVTHWKASRLLCLQAGYLKLSRDPSAIMETSIAKYFAAKAAARAAVDAVQIHGANGCSSAYPVERYMRDAKIMEIIEGSAQMHEITIADYAYQEFS